MFYFPWFGLLTLAGVLIVGGIIIYVLAQVLAKHPTPEWRKRDMLKHIYLYFILFVTLMMTIGGSIGVFAGIANFVSPPYYAETYEQFKQQRCDNNYMTPYNTSTLESTEDNGAEPAEAESDEIKVSEDADASVSSDRSHIQPWPYPGAKYCDEGELRDAYDRMIRDLEDDAKSDAVRSIIQSLGWIIVPLPVFIFFQRQLNRKTNVTDDTTTKKEE